MRVAVVGAGIAGLTAGIALARRGLSVEIFERASQLDEIGAGIQLSPNAMAVLQRLEVAPLLTEAIEPEAVDIRTGTSGRLLARIPLGAVARQRYGAPYCVLSRTHLQVALAAAARSRGVAIRLGATIVAERQNGLRIGSGGGRIEADAVVVADGVRSKLRRDHFGLSGARPIGATAWRGTLSAGRARAAVALDRVALWLMPGAHLVHYPIDGGKRVNLVLVAANSFPGLAAFGAARALIGRVEDWTPWPLLAVEEGEPWVRGNTVLIGDAAHAMPPTLAQGGAMGIEDSWELAAALGASGVKVEEALATYEQRRRGRIARVARDARFNLRLYEARGVSAVARNVAMAALPAKLHLRRLDWLFGWTPTAKFPLPGERPLP